jgi:hypothetical protein
MDKLKPKYKVGDHVTPTGPPNGMRANFEGHQSFNSAPYLVVEDTCGSPDSMFYWCKLPKKSRGYWWTEISLKRASRLLGKDKWIK